MASISVSSSVAQSGSTQSAVFAARRAAVQAQQTAERIQAQARDARTTVERAETNARAMDTRSSQATSEAAQAQQNLASLSNGGQSQSSLLAQVNPASRYAAGASPLPPVTNNQGQRLGMMINIVA